MANNSDIRYRQTLDNSQFKKGLKQSQSMAGQLKSQMMAMGPAVAAAFSVGAIVSFAKTAVAAYDAQEKANAKLFTALKGNADATQRLLYQSEQLAQVTLFQDEDIVNAQAMLAMLVKDEQAVKKLMPLVADFATAQEMDLASAAKLVAKAVGSETNALGRYGIQVEGAVGSSERLESAVNALTGAFGGQAEMAATTGAASIQQLDKAWGEFAETLGGAVAPALTSLARGLTEAVQGAEAMTKTKSLSFWDKFRIMINMSGRDSETVAEILGKKLDPAMEQATFTETKFTEAVEVNAEELEKEKEAAKAAAKAAEDLANQLERVSAEQLRKKLDFDIDVSRISKSDSEGLAGMIGDMDVEDPGIDVPIFSDTEQINSWVENYQAQQQKIEAVNDAINESMKQMAIVAVDAMGQLVEAMVSGEAVDFGAGILAGIGQIMQDLGKQIFIMSGLLELFQVSLSTLNPFVMAAAGLAFIAAGAVLKGIAKQSAQPMEAGGIVPGGFPNDTYPALLSSGETVIPAPHKLDAIGGGGVVVMETKVRGEDLYFIQRKMTSKHERYT